MSNLLNVAVNVCDNGGEGLWRNVVDVNDRPLGLGIPAPLVKMIIDHCAKIVAP